MALKLNDINAPSSIEATKKSSSENFLNKDINFGLSSSFGEKNKEQFYSGLSTLLASGVDLNRTLEILVEEYQKKNQKAIIQELINKVQAGDTLSSAMEKHTKHPFSLYETATVKIGEEIGKLALVTKELQIYYKGSIKRKRMLTSALSYPALVIIIAFLAVFFMMAFVVPMFEDVFKRFNGDLPDITQFVIDLSTSITENWKIIGLTLIGIIVGFQLLIKSERVKAYLSQVLVRIPFIGPFIVKNYLTKLAGVLGMLLGSGVHLLKALQLSKEVISFIPYKRALEVTIKEVETGGSLYNGMKNKLLFPNKFSSLVKIGEEVNKLDYFFNKANEEYNEELEHSTAILGTVLEPILLVFLGGVVGVILVAMYLPLFDLSGQW